jgi:hypothetical protein
MVPVTIISGSVLKPISKHWIKNALNSKSNEKVCRQKVIKKLKISATFSKATFMDK